MNGAVARRTAIQLWGDEAEQCFESEDTYCWINTLAEGVLDYQPFSVALAKHEARVRDRSATPRKPISEATKLQPVANCSTRGHSIILALGFVIFVVGVIIFGIGLIAAASAITLTGSATFTIGSGMVAWFVMEDGKVSDPNE